MEGERGGSGGGEGRKWRGSGGGRRKGMWVGMAGVVEAGSAGSPLNQACRPTWRHARGGTCCQGQVREAAEYTSQQHSCLLIFTRVTGVSVSTLDVEKRDIFIPSSSYSNKRRRDDAKRFCAVMGECSCV